MGVVLRLWSVEGMEPHPTSVEEKADMVVGVARGNRVLGPYIKDCDVEAHDGLGEAWFTNNKAEARSFADLVEATEFWRRQSTTKPLRDDGEPNRPLTAYNVTFEQT